MQSQQDYLHRFKFGDFVFGRCKGQLPWPAVITKVYKEPYYRVKFINHKSTADLEQQDILNYQQSRKIVLREYQTKNITALNKLIRALKVCQTQIYLQRQKETQRLSRLMKKFNEQDKKQKKRINAISNSHIKIQNKVNSIFKCTNKRNLSVIAEISEEQKQQIKPKRQLKICSDKTNGVLTRRKAKIVQKIQNKYQTKLVDTIEKKSQLPNQTVIQHEKMHLIQKNDCLSTNSSKLQYESQTEQCQLTCCKIINN